MLQKLSYVDWSGLMVSVLKVAFGSGLFVVIGLAVVLLNLLVVGGVS